MKTVSPKFVRLLLSGLISWIKTYVGAKIVEALANRPEIFTLTQEEYDALGDNLDPDAVYLIKEESTEQTASEDDNA